MSEVIFMSIYNKKPPRSKREKIGFYTAMSVCVIAVGMAAYSTFTSLSGYFDNEPEPTVAVERVVTGVEDTDITETQKPSETDPPATETEPPETEEKTEEETETPPKETKTALETMLSVDTSLSFPLDKAKVIKEYSEDTVYNKTLNQWTAHTGVDFACESGDNVYSMGEGKVTRVYKDDLLGNTIVVKSATYTAYYSGLSDNAKVKKGQNVKTGDILGTADTVPSEALDGNHVHIAIKADGQYLDLMSVLNNEE
jgi:murein DD-endopeptidase MepM/ murein hydrolase activator NlpD